MPLNILSNIPPRSITPKYKPIYMDLIINAIELQEEDWLDWVVKQPEIQLFLNEFTESGMTLLQEAAVYNLLIFTENLLNLGANPNIRDLVLGKTAYELAMEQEFFDVANLILQHQNIGG